MPRDQLVHERLTHSVIGAFFEVYNTLGFGFLEHVYVMALERELLARGHRVGREVCIPVMYKGEDLGTQRLDMIVDETLVVETKSTYDLHRAATRQLYNYLRATRLEVGLLLHFGPQAKFYRVLCRNSSVSNPRLMYPDDPFHPMHPYNPSS
ncbi:MAG: GxxExxY protein [Gemmatimonadaceae bacterium]